MYKTISVALLVVVILVVAFVLFGSTERVVIPYCGEFAYWKIVERGILGIVVNPVAELRMNEAEEIIECSAGGDE